MPDKTTDLRSKREGPVDKWRDRFMTERRGKLTWRDAGAEDLLGAVAAATEDGAAILLSRTSDGGALCIQVLSGTGRHKLYPATMEELTEALRMITEIASD